MARFPCSVIRFPSEKRGSGENWLGAAMPGCLQLFGMVVEGGGFGAGFFEALAEATGQVGRIVAEGAGGFGQIKGLQGVLRLIHGYVEKPEAAQAFIGDLGIGDGLLEALFSFGVTLLCGVESGEGEPGVVARSQVNRLAIFLFSFGKAMIGLQKLGFDQVEAGIAGKERGGFVEGRESFGVAGKNVISRSGIHQEVEAFGARAPGVANRGGRQWKVDLIAIDGQPTELGGILRAVTKKDDADVVGIDGFPVSAVVIFGERTTTETSVAGERKNQGIDVPALRGFMPNRRVGRSGEQCFLLEEDIAGKGNEAAVGEVGVGFAHAPGKITADVVVMKNVDGKMFAIEDRKSTRLNSS